MKTCRKRGVILLLLLLLLFGAGAWVLWQRDEVTITFVDNEAVNSSRIPPRAVHRVKSPAFENEFAAGAY